MRRRLYPLTTALVLGACLLGLWQNAPDLLFALQGEAVELGSAPPPHALRPDGHARLRGRVLLSTPADVDGAKRELVLLADAPVAVLLRPDAPAARPGEDVLATGRLYRADQLGNLYAGNPWVRVAELRGVPVEQLFVLMDGVHPAFPGRALAWSALLVVLLAFSTWRLVRVLRASPSRHRTSP